MSSRETIEIQQAKPSTPITRYIIWIVIGLVVIIIIRGFAKFANSPIGRLLGKVLDGVQSAIAWMMNNSEAFLWILAGVAFLFSPLAGLSWKAMRAVSRGVSKLTSGEGKFGDGRVVEKGEESVRKSVDATLKAQLGSDSAAQVGVTEEQRLRYRQEAQRSLDSMTFEESVDYRESIDPENPENYGIDIFEEKRAYEIWYANQLNLINARIAQFQAQGQNNVSNNVPNNVPDLSLPISSDAPSSFLSMYPSYVATPRFITCTN
jgi:hypothetical protein